MEKKIEITDRGRAFLDTLEQDSEGRYVITHCHSFGAVGADRESKANLAGICANEIGDAVLVVNDHGYVNGIVSVKGGGVFASAFGAHDLVVGFASEPLIEILGRSFWTVRNANAVSHAVETATRKSTLREDA